MNNLTSIKFLLKERITKELEEAICFLKDKISSKSVVYNNVILLEGRLSETNKQIIRGIITSSEGQLVKNQVRQSLIEIIDSIESSDLNEELYPIGEQSLLNNENEKIECKLILKSFETRIFKIGYKGYVCQLEFDRCGGIIDTTFRIKIDDELFEEATNEFGEIRGKFNHNFKMPMGNHFLYVLVNISWKVWSFNLSHPGVIFKTMELFINGDLVYSE